MPEAPTRINLTTPSPLRNPKPEFKPPNRLVPLADFSYWQDLLTESQTVKLANSLRLRILSNKLMDEILLSEGLADSWVMGGGVVRARVSPLVAYTFPDVPFGEFIGGYMERTARLMIPARFQGVANRMLAIPHDISEDGKPTFEIVSQGDLHRINILDESRVMLLPAPVSSGWHIAEDAFGIPVGAAAADDSDQNARHITGRAKYVGFIGRGVILDTYVDGRKDVFLDVSASSLTPALAEVPEWVTDVPKFVSNALSALAENAAGLAERHLAFIAKQLNNLLEAA